MNEPAGKGARKDRFAAVQAELEARTSEAEWLKTHYDEQLRAAFAQISSLQARVRTPASQASASALNLEERAMLERLKAEVERLTAAQSRYLDRIEELKEALERGQA